MDSLDASQLPFDVKSKLAELELELSEGDITEKGYQKKKMNLLARYLEPQSQSMSPILDSADSVPTGAHMLSGAGQIRSHPQNGLTNSSEPCSSYQSGDVLSAVHIDESQNCGFIPTPNRQYIHGIREEAVSEALSDNRWHCMEALVPDRRQDNGRSPSSNRPSVRITDYSGVGASSECSSRLLPVQSGVSHSPPAQSLRMHTPDFNEEALQNPRLPTHFISRFPPGFRIDYDQVPTTDELASAINSFSNPIESDSLERMAVEAAAHLGLNDIQTSHQYLANNLISSLSHSEFVASSNPGLQLSFPSPPILNTPSCRFTSTPCAVDQSDVLTSNSVIPRSDVNVMHDIPSCLLSADSTSSELRQTDDFNWSMQSVTPSSQETSSQTGVICPNRVSSKIQQLVNTLKRPKRRPLPEYFLDEEDQVLIRPVIDASAPRPQGPPSQPLRGGELVIPSGLPRNLESALQRYAGLSVKTLMLTCLDLSGRPTQVLTYAKLLQRSIRIAYMLLNKVGHRGEQSLRPGDRVALLYANNEPISFLFAFYGCILASVIPISIEVPSARRDVSYQSMGFLLSNLDARVVLVSEQCYKTLPRNSNEEISTYPGWPRVTWINTDHHGAGTKPPKDWVPPDRLSNDECLYIEYTFSKDGSVHGVMTSRRAALSHCRALTAACSYSEEDVVVCVVDCRREIGLWHAVLSSVFNGLHVIFVPYSVMQVDPGSWLRMVTKFRATVAIVKSRDIHWALLAERDHPNVNLSSIRMLLVADGSNPWSLNACDSFVQKFRNRGFRAEAVCPAAGDSETLTLCLRRPPLSVSTGTTRNGNGFQQVSSAGMTACSAVRGVISIHCLAYGVIRVDSEDSLSSLTLQDCGQVLPGASAVVVRLGPKPVICRTDELGEICLAADYTGSGYWGLRGQTGTHFHVEPVDEDGSPINPPGSVVYTRSGFLGFSGPASSGSLIFVCGSVNGLMTIAGRRHNADDVIATVLAVQPTKIVYRGRIAVFSVDLLKDERMVVVAELRSGFSDEAAFTWMSLVLQAVDSIHQVSIYCLCLVQQNSLPRTPFGGINYHSVKHLFSEGQLHPSALLLCPHSAIQNLPQPRQVRPGLVGPSAIMCGQVVQGVRMAEARGRPLPANSVPCANSPLSPDGKSQHLTEILIWRATHTPDERLFTVYNHRGQETSTLTCVQLLRRAERLACLLQERGRVSVGSVVSLLYTPGIELVCAFYACLLIGAIPVPVKPPRTEPQQDACVGVKSGQLPASQLSGPPGSGSTSGLGVFGPSGSGGQFVSGSTDSWMSIHGRLSSPTFSSSLELVWNVVNHSGTTVILTQQSIIKLLKSKEATNKIPFGHWPAVLDSEETFRKKVPPLHQNPCLEQPIAYLDFAASTTGTITGIRVTHEVAYALCRAQKVQCEFYPTREVVLSLDPYSGLGFTLWTLTSVYCGHHSILVPPSVSEIVPDLWLTVCSQRKVRDAFCSHVTMELATRYMAKHMSLSKHRDITLSSLRSLVIVAEERPRVHLIAMFCKLFSCMGLVGRAVTTSFGCRANLAISLQGASSPESTTVYVDRISLRNDRIKLLEKGSPNSLCLMESGKLLPGVHVAIANPDTYGQCADSQLGEIWVCSPHNSTDLLGPFDSASLSRALGASSEPLIGSGATDVLHARLVTGDTGRVYSRTGFLGFVRRTELTQLDGELHDAIFVVGSLEEAIVLRGMRFHPVDIESTVMRAHKKICECAVFTWSNLLVVVVELVGEEKEAMDLVHPVTAHVLAEHQLIVGVVVVTDPGTVPVNAYGEKQRILLRDSFVNDKLDPIYVSYNM